MEQEDKELLIRDLCARVPYEPWIWFKENWETNPNFKGCQSQLRLYHLEYIVKDMDITLKPYLRPLSSMTDEEKYELYGVNGVLSIDFEFEEYKMVHLLKSHNVIDWFNAHHFDYRGLIEKGLALVAPDGMYNN